MPRVKSNDAPEYRADGDKPEPMSGLDWLLFFASAAAFAAMFWYGLVTETGGF